MESGNDVIYGRGHVSRDDTPDLSCGNHTCSADAQSSKTGWLISVIIKKIKTLIKTHIVVLKVGPQYRTAKLANIRYNKAVIVLE